MIIRSQDKSSIVNFNGVDTIKAVSNKRRNEIKEHYETNIVYFGCAKDGLLGTYSTEEKAMKVLDELFYAFRNMAFVDETTFQMPQDSEV